MQAEVLSSWLRRSGLHTRTNSISSSSEQAFPNQIRGSRSYTCVSEKGADAECKRRAHRLEPLSYEVAICPSGPASIWCCSFISNRHDTLSERKRVVKTGSTRAGFRAWRRTRSSVAAGLLVASPTYSRLAAGVIIKNFHRRAVRLLPLSAQTSSARTFRPTVSSRRCGLERLT